MDVTSTSMELFSFSKDPPNPLIMASAISSVVPAQFLSDSSKVPTDSGALLMRASHGDIWFFPNIADAAAICSTSDSPANLSCSSFWMVTQSFIWPFPSVMDQLRAAIASLPSLAGDTSLARPVFNELAALSASIPLLAITPMYRAASFTLYPAAENTGAATDMAPDRPSTSRAELLHAAANTSA